MMSWWRWLFRRRRNRPPASLPIRHVDGVAFFAQVDMHLIRRDEGGWIAYAANWNTGARGQSAEEAMLLMWQNIETLFERQEYPHA